MASTGPHPPGGPIPTDPTHAPNPPASSGSNTTGGTGATPSGSEADPIATKPTTFEQLLVKVKSTNATSTDKIPVDVSFDRLVTINAQSEESKGQDVTIRDTLRFNLSENLSGEATLSDVIYPSSLTVEVLGGDGIPKVRKDAKVTKENTEGLSIDLTQADVDTILKTAKPPPKQDSIIERPALFVEIAMNSKAPKANFANANLLVAPLRFGEQGADWTRDGFASILKSDKGPITIAQPLKTPLPVGIASLPWTESRVAVDGRFTAKFIAGNYNAWAWLLTGARPDSMLGVIADDNLKEDSVQVRSIILPSAPAPSDSGSGQGDDKGTPAGGDSGECHCDSGTRVPAVVSETELANNPDVYTEDPGSFCKPFSNPERILSERSFYSILRIEQPVLSASASSLLRNPLLLDLDPVGFNPAVSHLADAQPRTLAFNLGTINRANLIPKFGGIWDVLEGGRYEMSAKHPMQWEGDSLKYQATTVAVGHILEFRLRTRSNGYSLGGVAKTMTLAPRQTKRIEKIEWARTERAARIERGQLTDATNDSMTHDTSYQDAVGATLNEWSQGSSSSSVTSAAAGGGLALGPVVIGGGVATSSSKSSSQQRGGRDTTASEESQWRDAVRRHGDALRKQESMVVQEVTESETVTGTTEVIRNINYAHSLTVVYHNILRHLRVDTEFAAVRECLFVPLAMKPFTQERALRWKETLARVLRNRKYSRAMTYIKDVVTNFANSSIPPGRRSDHPIRSLWGSIYIEIGIPRPSDSADGKYDATNWARLLPFLPLPALSIWQQLQVMVESLKDQAFQKQYAPTIARKWCDHLQIKDSNKVLTADFTLATEYRFNGRVRVDFTADTEGVTRETLSNITISALDPLLPGSIANVKSLSYNYETDYERGSVSLNRGTADLISSDLGTVDLSGAKFSSVPSAYERTNVQDELRFAVKDLVDHLNEYVEYYHKAIWWNMDRDRLFMLIDGFTVPKLDKAVSIANVVERDPIAFAGNSLVFRVSAGVFIGSKDPKLEDPEALFNHYNTGKGVSAPMHISLPTDGLYAQTIMDDCNALEEHYGNHDWALNDPDPELGPLDPSLLTTRRADPPKTDPTPFPSTIINLSNATPAPGPQGVAGALNAVQNANAFRDMAGLAGTQQLATAGLTAATSLATSFGASAAALKMADTAGKQQAVADADKKLASIARAKDKQLIPNAEAEKQAVQVLQDMSGSQPAKAPHEDPAIQSIIKSAKEASDNGAPTSLEASTTEGSVLLNFGMPESAILASNVAANGARRPRPDFQTFQREDWDYASHPNSTEVLRALNDAWVNNSAFSNTCTMRISRGLNYSGVLLPKPGKFNGLLTIICKDGRPYAIRVKEMRKYLTTIWGEPDFDIKNKRSGEDFNPADHPELVNHNGIIAFDIAFGGTAPASGHFDIWNGVMFSHESSEPEAGATDPKDYWKLATRISLWYLPMSPDVEAPEDI